MPRPPRSTDLSPPTRAGSRTGYQLKITLRGIQPPIWRRLVVPADLPLPKLHQAFQIAMGWHDCHLHMFRAGHRAYALPDPDSFEPLGEDERRATLAQLVPRAGRRFEYEYDFGDGWMHSVLVEKELPQHDGSVRCLAGKRACPPEDCGGPGGYGELLEILANPKHEEHAERLDWCGPLEPEEFEAARVDGRLQVAFAAKKASRQKPRAHQEGAE